MRCLWIVAMLATGCGRLEFGAVMPDEGPAGDASSDAVTGDGSPDAPAVTACPDDPTLLACYDFEGDATDAAQGLDLTPTVVTYVAGVSGLAVRVVPGSDLSRPDEAAFSIAPPVTVELWLNPSAAPLEARGALVDKQDEYGVFITSAMSLQCSAAVLPSTISLNRWTHVACVLDGATSEGYVDGNLVGTFTDNVVLDAGGELVVGHNSPAGEAFDGAIDSLRIWERRLGVAEVCAAAGRTGC